LLQHLLDTKTEHYATIWSIYVSHGSALTKLGAVENEFALHNFVILAINKPKIIKVSKSLRKL